MRLLILSFEYKPDLSPRAFRWSEIAEHWVAQGHDVTVVCRHVAGQPHREKLHGVSVHRVGGSSRIKSWLNRGAGADPRASQGVTTARSSTRMGLYRLAKKVYGATWRRLYWPDYATLWYRPARRAALRLCREQKFDAVISSSLPFTPHLVGLALKRIQPARKWVVDVGDPFSFMDLTPLNNAALYRRRNARAERVVLQRADAITVTVQAAADEYARSFPEAASKIKVIPPLVSISAPHRAANAEGAARRLVYLGTLYRDIRSPAPMLAMFRALRQTSLGKGLELHIYGDVHDCRDLFAAESDPAIHLHGLVARDQAARALQEADILINIGNTTRYQLPSKVIEYASAAKPILNLVRVENDSSALALAAYPAARSVNPERLTPELVNELTDFIAAPPAIDERALAEWLTQFKVEAIAAAYLKAIDARSDLH